MGASYAGRGDGWAPPVCGSLAGWSCDVTGPEGGVLMSRSFRLLSGRQLGLAMFYFFFFFAGRAIHCKIATKETTSSDVKAIHNISRRLPSQLGRKANSKVVGSVRALTQFSQVILEHSKEACRNFWKIGVASW